MAEITVDPNISSYNADKKRYGPIQEARRGDLEKSRLFGGKKRGQDQTLGATSYHWSAQHCRCRKAPLLLTPVSDGKLRLIG